MERLYLLLALTALTAFAQPESRALLAKYCVTCHNQKLKTANLVLEGLDPANPAANAAVWEKVIRQMRGRQMPPAGLPRPDETTALAFTKSLADALDRAASLKPDPGATRPHRLNRNEYSNAIRDLLALDTQPGNLLPVDESGNGFDNMADLLSMSPALLERYMSAARMVSRQAIGDLKTIPAEAAYGTGGRGHTKGQDPDAFPFGAANGLAFQHYFPVDAEYEFRIKLAGGGDDETATIYKVRLPVTAGLRPVTAAFLRESAKPEVALRAGRRPPPAPGSMAATKPAELDLRLDGASIQRFQPPQRAGAPEVGTVTIAGPYQATGRGETPSRAKIFVCRPAKAADEAACARTILAGLIHRAFRRPVTDADVHPLFNLYRQARTEGADFDDGIGAALQAVLVSPDFLFRVERDRKGAVPGSPQRLDDHELAARISFFLWSSIPDDELLKLADEGKLKDPAVRKAQLARMMADPRSEAFVKNFGGQWLYLRTLAQQKPDADIFSSFDEDLRFAFRRETELFLASILRNGDSVLDLLSANYTFLNQRLAEHYKIPGVYGPHFRRVDLHGSPRGGLLGQGSILTVTSYPNRTSVVQRGKWILENLLGTPPPPPPADVPELQAKAKDGRKLSLREAMQVHRANAVCASCHGRMDPIGFALENFNAVGEWRQEDAGVPIDAKGKLPNGAEFDGPAGLKKLLLDQHRDEFVQTIAEKLLIYGLGRGLEPCDRPTVRAITAQAARENYRLTAFIAAIVESTPFQMRRTSEK
jgi:mono/diheme cytochrome c family protein